jgi:hypothetical protein
VSNTPQVGGNHYAKGGDFQHWDLIERYGIGYLEGYATKYILRWRDKNGVEDLKKALHCVEKLISLREERVRFTRGEVPREVWEPFFTSYPMGLPEQRCFVVLCGSWNLDELRDVAEILTTLIRENNGSLQNSPA